MTLAFAWFEMKMENPATRSLLVVVWDERQ